MINSSHIIWTALHQSDAQKELSSTQWNWISDHGSLTHRLRLKLSEHIHFHLKFAGIGEVSEEETIALDQQPTTLFWIREIEWHYRQDPIIAARVVIPMNSKNTNTKALYEAGNASIGEILFKPGCYTRDPLYLAKLPPIHPYYKLALPNKSREYLWARRSIFRYQEDRLLVAEVFLPLFFDHIMTNISV